MHANLYHHYLQKLGITLWVPSDFQWPPQALDTPEVLAKPTAELNVEPIDATVAKPATLSPASFEMPPKPAAASLLSTLPPVCGLKSVDKARLTVVASPGNDPRSGGRPNNDNVLENMLLSIGIAPEQFSLVQVAREQDHNKSSCSGKILLVTGQLAASLLFNRPLVLASMRGKIHQVGEHRIVVTYHPDELRKNPALKKMAWQDLRLLAVALTQT